MVSSYTAKQLRVTFTLSNNAVFASSNSNVLTLSGLRTIARIQSFGVQSAPQATVEIFGMFQSDMNALTMLAWKPRGLQRNTVLVEANGGDGWTQVFSGQIIQAGPDYANAPDVMLRVQAVSAYFEKIAPAAPSSYTGPTDVAGIVKDLAGKMGYAFENNGVTAQLSNPYLPNTLGEQLRAVCQQAGIDLYIDIDTIAICPRGQPRKLDAFTLNDQTGLIGYPSIDIQGVNVIALFNPKLRFGAPVMIESDVPKANGQWYIYSIELLLESEKAGGAWFSFLNCTEFGTIRVAS